MKSERGEFRGIYSVMIESPEFLALKSNSRLMLFVLKLKLGPSGIGVISGMIAALGEHTGLNALQTADALGELETAGWIKTQGNIVWIVNGLRYEPALSSKLSNHRTSVLNHLNSLPRLRIVDDYRRYYADWLQIEAPTSESGDALEVEIIAVPEKGSKLDAGGRAIVKAKPVPSSWVAEGTAWWQEHVGTIAYGRFGTALTPLVHKYTWEKVFPALQQYAATQDNVRVEWFAANGVKLIESSKSRDRVPQWQIEEEDAGLAKAHHVTALVSAYKKSLNGKGEEWWTQMVREAKAKGRHPIVYAYEIAKVLGASDQATSA